MPDVPIISPGIYCNIFNVSFNADTITIPTLEADKVADYDTLQTKLEAEGITFLYREGRHVYGHGINTPILFKQGFTDKVVKLRECPRLTARMISRGFADKVAPEHNVYESKGRMEFVSKRKCATLLGGRVSIYRAYDTRCLFLRDHSTDSIEFGIVIDTNFKLKDQNGEPLDSHKIKQHFDQGALSEIRTFQGDLVPGGKINTEVSRQKLLEETIPFVQQYSSITLPGGIAATIATEPMHIVIGGD